jgi:hypothetical protein
MPTIASSNIPTPQSWEEFESIVLSTAKIRWKSTDFFGNGRRGQRQDGVDVFGTSNDGTSLGIQCKNTQNGLSAAVVRAEVNNAESFSPPLQALFIATTAPRDSSLQEVVREISEERIRGGKFNVGVLFWDDISGDLSSNETEFFKHYPQFAPKRDLPKEHDQKLYDVLLELLPTSGIINFLGQNNMAGFSFLDSNLEPLFIFHREWNKPDHEFIYPELESIRKQLWQKADDYLEIIATQTFSTGRSAERRSVPEEWEYEQPERFSRVVKSLHDLASEIVALHGTLIRTARDYFVGII